MENFKSGHRVRVVCSGAELSELGRTEPLAECRAGGRARAGQGLEAGLWRLQLCTERDQAPGASSLGQAEL